MAIFGLTTRKEMQAAIDSAIKATRMTNEKWLLETARAQAWDMPDPSVYSNQAETYRVSSWVSTAVEMVASTAAPVPFSVKRREAEELRTSPTTRSRSCWRSPTRT